MEKMAKNLRADLANSEDILRSIVDRGQEMLDCVVKLHEMNHMHRQLNGDCFMINSEGKVKMIKFGFAKLYIQNGSHIELERYNSVLLRSPQTLADQNPTQHPLTNWQKE